jgi:thioester reductase-like protein
MDEPNEIERVAVIGMAGRFPGARDLEQFWDNLRAGRESIRDLTPEELARAGVDPSMRSHPAYVPRTPTIEGIELFDAPFFGFSPREAEILDPQHRVFLECAWEALESAGYVSEDYPGWVGVFAGASLATYLFQNLFSRPDVVAANGGGFPLVLANDRDYFSTRVSYKLNLRGLSLNVQTACSTSLVAVHLASQSLLSYQCDVALAGGVRVSVPQDQGYLYQEGSIFSPDGRCRAFDAGANGSIFGEGVGVVVLKRLSEALRDGDPIHAVVLGSAVNNDGSFKIGYTAPSVEGQAEVISMAQGIAEVDPRTITYVETHGSGTPLGDPIEVRALTQAFREKTDATGFCGLGSVKTNVGHLEAAAGVAGFIKTVLALKHRQIPPSLHFEKPNPRIDFDASPFYVNARLRDWESEDGTPRRAGVSSFGMGGTNAHVILEEAPEPEPSGPSRPWQFLILSARTETALEAATDRLAEALDSHPEWSLADVAHTLQAARRGFEHRRTLLCQEAGDAITALRGRDPRRLLTGVAEPGGRAVAFLLPGVGEQYPGMARGLYETEPTFRETVDQCAELLQAELDLDLRDVLFAGEGRKTGGELDLKALLGRAESSKDERLHRTAIAQPAVFVIDYALARLWMEWGVVPEALIGYSLGEYVAACLAGVLSLEDALALVARRARLIEGLPEGAMLAVPLPEAEVRSLLGPDLSIAAVNGPAMTVVAGPSEAVASLEERLAGREVASRRLETRHAFHSGMMEPIRESFAALVREVELNAPEVRWLSNVTGTWITDEEATDPGYWVRHLLQTVRFADGLAELLRDGSRALVEVGPGRALSTLAAQSAGPGTLVLPSLPSVHERRPDEAFLLDALGRLWLAGVKIDWTGFAAHETRHRLTLPTYPFERKRYWIDPAPLNLQALASAPAGPAALASEAPEPPPAPAMHARPASLRNPYVAPEREDERRLAAIWSDLLGVAEVGLHDDFFQLGGHSLLAPQLLNRLRDAFGVELPLPVLFQAPTVAQLAEAVAQVRREGSARSLLEAAAVDLRAEVELDPAIRPEGPLSGDAAHPRAVFLTGASGFLGAHLLDELLRRTDATVHCLVRVASVEEGERRLRRGLEQRRLWDDRFAPRIVAVPGDLTEPGFGLSGESFRDLAGRVDAVYHCGAWVNFTYPYTVLKPVNVGGTIEVIRLACAVRAKPLHFVSSISVFSALTPTVDGFAQEDAPLDETRGLFGGYGESKWVGEKLVGLARSRGLPASIYRPGIVGGDSRTGIGNTGDLAWNLIKGAIQAGAAPDDSAPFDVTPVDYVAGAIVALSLQSGCLDRAYHFPNPAPRPWNEVYDFARRLGYPLRQLPFSDWLDELAEDVRRDPNQALAPFAPMLAAGGAADRETTNLNPGESPIRGFDGTHTREGLAGTGVTCPPVDEKLLTTYFDFFIESGFLESPQPEPVGALREGLL